MSTGKKVAAGILPRDGGPARNSLPIRQDHPRLERMVRRTAYWGLVTAGRPLRHARMLPGFLIVGTQRAGTSSMFEALRQHPAVFSAVMPRKEVHYFDLFYSRGPAWYQCHFPLIARARLSARSTGVAAVAFEATPSYMFHPLAAERIQRDLPGVRLLVMLRDPVARAYSAHIMNVGRGYETEPFERALELEDERLKGETERVAADPAYISYSLRRYSYRAYGHYIDQLERLERLFGRDRIHIIDSGDFFADPRPVYDQMLDFLCLPHQGYPAFERPKTRPRPPMPESVRTALEDHYRPYDERLAAWLGYELSWRR